MIDTNGSVTAVVVNWQRPEDTLRCLASLRQCRPESPKLVVVDNDSDSAAIAPIVAAHPGLDLFRFDSNRGFAAGANLGIRHALAEGAAAVLLVNDDAEVEPDCLYQLVETAAPRDVAAATHRSSGSHRFAKA